MARLFVGPAICPFAMRSHPIPPVTEPLQYRAIGIVRGKYIPNDLHHITRGRLVDLNGIELEAVLLGRVLALMRRHIDQDKPHLWVVYPRYREIDHLHLQITGIWEPSTLSQVNIGESDLEEIGDIKELPSDELPEGDNYFSIRGELIYTKPETEELVVKIRQRSKANGRRPLPFKLNLKGKIPSDQLRHFVSLEVRRNANQLCLEDYKVIAPIPTRGGKRKGGKRSILRKTTETRSSER